MVNFIKTFLRLYLLGVLVFFMSADIMLLLQGEIEVVISKTVTGIRDNATLMTIYVIGCLLYTLWQYKHNTKTELEALEKTVLFFTNFVLSVMVVSFSMRFLDLSLYTYYVNLIVVGYFLLTTYRQHIKNKE